MDMFKALALGADAVLIGRPFVTTVYGGGEEGVQLYVQKLKAELADTMRMCGAHSLAGDQALHAVRLLTSIYHIV